jgi:hypothetical protein
MERTKYSDEHIDNMFEALTNKLIQASEAFQLHDALFTEIKEDIEILKRRTNEENNGSKETCKEKEEV